MCCLVMYMIMYEIEVYHILIILASIWEEIEYTRALVIVIPFVRPYVG